MLEINIPMCEEFSVLGQPPYGHAGCYAIQEIPQIGVGEEIVFNLDARGKKIAGTVTAIEPPGKCLRNDMAEFLNWYKIHWTPVERIPGLNSPSCVCPECGKRTQVYWTQNENGRLVRGRRCKGKCGVSFKTVEVVISGTFKQRTRNAKKSLVRR